MSDINFCNTKEQLNHLGEVVTGKVDGSPTGADIDTSTLPYTGQVRNTLPALEELYLGEINEFIQESDQVITDKTAELNDAVNDFIQESDQVITDKTAEFDTSIANKEAEASAAIDAYRLLSKGPYAAGILLEDKFQYITYNGESYFATNPPYTTTATTPDADGNLFVGGYLNQSTNLSASPVTATGSTTPRTLGDRFAEVVINKDTLQDAIDYTGAYEGCSVNLKERTTGNGGGAMWDYVLASSVSEYNAWTIACTGNPLLALRLRIDGTTDGTAFGVVADGITDNALALNDYADFCRNNLYTFNLPDGKFFCSGDLDLWGVTKIDVKGSVLFPDTTGVITVGGSTVSVPSTNIDIYATNGVVRVHGMNRGDFKLNYANKLHLYASDDVPNRKTVSYCRFEWVNVDTVHLECQDTAGGVPWINENKFYCGRTRLAFTMDGTYPMNNNIFYGICMESITVTIERGQNNYFHDVRLEGTVTFNFGDTTFNNIFYQTWGNFANTAMWDQDVSTYNITDTGDNNRIVCAHHAYTEKDMLLDISRESLGDGVAFEVSSTDPSKVKIKANAYTFLDTGLLPVTDKLWFRLTGQVPSFFVYMDVYDEDGSPITVEPSSGFKTSAGGTAWNPLGYYEYTNPVLGGAYAVNPIKDSSVKYVRFRGKTDNGATGDEHTGITAMVSYPQEDKHIVKNIVEDAVRIDAVSNRTLATSEAVFSDLFKFSAGSFSNTSSVGLLSGELSIAVTSKRGGAVKATSIKAAILVSKEGTSNIAIKVGTAEVVSSGGSLTVDGVEFATKAGATNEEAVLTIRLTSSTHSDPFDYLSAKARITGIADFNPYADYLISAHGID